MTRKPKRERGPVHAPLLLRAFALLFSHDSFYLRACNDGTGYILRETSYLFLFLSFLLVQLGSLDDSVFPNSPISWGDFQDVPALDSEQSPVQRKEERAVEGQEIGASTENEVRLFSCPVEGCVSTFQRHCNLERHLHYGKCTFVEEKHTLLDKAKMVYTEDLQKASSAQPFIVGSVLCFKNKVVRCSRRGGHCDLPKRLRNSMRRKKAT